MSDDGEYIFEHGELDQDHASYTHRFRRGTSNVRSDATFSTKHLSRRPLGADGKPLTISEILRQAREEREAEKDTHTNTGHNTTLWGQTVGTHEERNSGDTPPSLV